MVNDMTFEESRTIEIKNDFYRDSLGKVLLIILSLVLAATLLTGLVLFMYFNKPAPISFTVGNEWRVKDPVPLNDAYLPTPDLLQWTSDVLRQIFVFDFNHYSDQLKSASQYFTPTGWAAFLNHLNIYANYNNVQNGKLFINAIPEGAPFILNQGLLSGRYGWWVQMPVKLNYEGLTRLPSVTLTLQLLLVRIPTDNNLSGVGIDNIIVAKSENQL
jgi:intracellular multiplication protein IcmL